MQKVGFKTSARARLTTASRLRSRYGLMMVERVARTAASSRCGASVSWALVVSQRKPTSGSATVSPATPTNTRKLRPNMCRNDKKIIFYKKALKFESLWNDSQPSPSSISICSILYFPEQLFFQKSELKCKKHLTYFILFTFLFTFVKKNRLGTFYSSLSHFIVTLSSIFLSFCSANLYYRRLTWNTFHLFRRKTHTFHWSPLFVEDNYTIQQSI